MSLKIDDITFMFAAGILGIMVGFGFGVMVGGQFASMPNGYMMDGDGHRIPCTEYWDSGKWGVK